MYAIITTNRTWHEHESIQHGEVELFDVTGVQPSAFQNNKYPHNYDCVNVIRFQRWPSE